MHKILFTVLVGLILSTVAFSGTPRSAFQVKNVIINGNFDFWQRGNQFTQATMSVPGYTADRFQWYKAAGNFQIDRTVVALGTFSTESTYSYKMTYTGGSAASDYILTQKIEGVRSLANKTVTLSYWVRANRSMTIQNRYSQYFGTGGSPSSSVDGTWSNVSVTTGWVKISVLLAVPSISGKTIGSNIDDALFVQWLLADDSPVSLGANVTSDWVEIAQVMLNEGPSADGFQSAGGDVQGEFAKCLRYYEIVYVGMSSYLTAGQANFVDAPFKVEKRTGCNKGGTVSGGSTEQNIATKQNYSNSTKHGTMDIRPTVTGYARSLDLIYTCDDEL